MAECEERDFEVPRRFNLRGLHFHRFGGMDPTAQWSRERFLKACHTPEGAVTLSVELAERVRLRAWGPGAAFLLSQGEELLGLGDEPSALNLERDDRLRKVPSEIRDLRLVCVPWRTQHLIQTVLEQRVTWREAASSFARICRKVGLEAPGPYGLLLPPPPRVWARLRAPEYASVGVEHKRAQTIREVARQHARIDSLPKEQLRDFVCKLRGIGVWSREQLMGAALGDADAVPLGDYDLPSRISYALADEARADDSRMLELLEPYRGQRFRVIRWLMEPGFDPPKYGPKVARSRALGSWD